MNLSSNTIIETRDLSFKFKSEDLILNSVSLKVEKGSIYGFLGPNGAGKTTTIRLLLGLLPAPNNSIKLFGNCLSANRIGVFTKIGSLIEHPSLYEHLSGWDNLDITRRIRNVKKERISEVFELVNLLGASKKLVKDYSLGMKQRLGLALALLSDPELLILDEPVNGLDPSGIIEIRELLLKLNNEAGITIFLSSHLLSEIEKFVTHIGIIKKGNLIFQGTLQQLKEINQTQGVLQIETNDISKAKLILKKTHEVTQKNDNSLEIPFEDKQQIASVARMLISNGLDIHRLNVLHKDLETTFIELTEKKHERI